MKAITLTAVGTVKSPDLTLNEMKQFVITYYAGKHYNDEHYESGTEIWPVDSNSLGFKFFIRPKMEGKSC